MDSEDSQSKNIVHTAQQHPVPQMNTPVSQQIIERFYLSLDALISQKRLRGINTYCTLYHIDRRNLIANRKDLSRGWFQVSWLHPLVIRYGISAHWLLTGHGPMFSDCV